jgi:sigma-B regulation protein RsbU (phosphoserine phosphatase)
MFRNLSLTARLSLLFFLFTLVNVVLFWLAVGSNQMRLLAEKASLQMHRTIVGIEQKLQLATAADPLRRSAEFYRTPAAETLIAQVFREQDRAIPEGLLEYGIVSGSSVVLLAWPKELPRAELSADEVQNIVKTIRLREFSNEPFYSFPDVLNYRLTVYLPFANDRGQYLILRAVFALEGMKTELSRLMRLGIAMVILLLIVQTAFGFFLYRLIVRPLRELKIASQITGRGDFHQIAGYEQRRDEVGTLVAAFNKMSADIRDQKETIRKNFEEIRHRDEMMQHELMIAQHIQKSIFPKNDYPHPVSLEYKPLYAVSGDFYDVYQFEDGSTGYLVCDASGHGVPAALLTMMAKSAFATFARQYRDPGEVMQAANRHLADSLEMTGQYLTAFYVRVSPGKIAYCNATHPEPVVVVYGQAEPVALRSNGFYVGMLSEAPFEFQSETLETPKGSKLVIVSDGITEARNTAGELYGAQRLRNIVAASAALDVNALRDAILSDLANFAGGTPAEDDVTLLVLEV